MADVERLRQILALCEDYDLAMVEVSGIKVVFNKAEETEATEFPTETPKPEYNGPKGYNDLFQDGEEPKFNRE
jgi:hypothetical protein